MFLSIYFKFLVQNLHFAVSQLNNYSNELPYLNQSHYVSYAIFAISFPFKKVSEICISNNDPALNTLLWTLLVLIIVSV
jgi:hypothetical protein